MRNNNKGYEFLFEFSDGDVLIFPVTPSELTMKSGSNNKVVTLINEGDINILKSPSLSEIEFDAMFPMKQYPFARQTHRWEDYYERIRKLKEEKKSFRFQVIRLTPSGDLMWGTDELVSLEDFTVKESADQGNDIIVSFKLKQYKEYGVKTLPNSYLSKPNTTSTSSETRKSESPASNGKTHKVKSGDCLWNISKYYYGNGAKWKTIYNANKTAIENDAKKHGRKSSQEGHWIYPGLVLTIPNA